MLTRKTSGVTVLDTGYSIGHLSISDGVAIIVPGVV